MTRLAALLALAACHAPAVVARTAQAESAPSPMTVLHVLQDADGVAVRGALTEMDGRLFGLAGERGPNGSPQCSSSALWHTPEHERRCPGTIFSLRLDGSDFRVDHAFTPLDDVTGRSADGYHPYGTLAVCRPHVLCGVAQAGGSPPDPAIAGYGVLFAYEPARSDDTGSFEVLHHFFSETRATDGEYPMGALAVDAAGNVYGTAKGGGSSSSGTAWEWSPGGAFRWSPLPAAAGETYGGLTLASGMLHGTWGPGLAAGSYFTVDPATLAVRVVATFPGFTYNEHGTDNTPIQAPVALRDGTVVAVREFGGPFGTGLVARLDPVAGITPLWSPQDIPLVAAPRFANTTGGMLNGRVVEGRDGLLYGTAQYGGAAGTGAIWRIARDGTLQQVLWSWSDGAYPYGGLTLGSDGAWYGVTFNTGQVFRYVAPASACVGY